MPTTPGLGSSMILLSPRTPMLVFPAKACFTSNLRFCFPPFSPINAHACENNSTTSMAACHGYMSYRIVTTLDHFQRLRNVA